MIETFHFPLHLHSPQLTDSAPYETVLVARFLMVARDPLNRGSAFVAPLKPDGAEEEAIFAEGTRHKSLRQKSATESLLKVSETLVVALV